jgi:nitroreductase
MSDGITMTNAIIESLVSRSTTSLYDPAVTLTDDQIRELVRIATTAPTSFHLQNWRFIAVRTPEAKARLRPIAWDQPKITAAAVTFIVCGQLTDHSVIPKRLAPVVEAGIMPAEMVLDYEKAARRLYFEKPQCQRDEAIRTGAIAATAMMYAANALGLGSTHNRFRPGTADPRVRTSRGRSAGHAGCRRGEASAKLAAEAAPSGGRCHGIRLVEEVGHGVPHQKRRRRARVSLSVAATKLSRQLLTLVRAQRVGPGHQGRNAASLPNRKVLVELRFTVSLAWHTPVDGGHRRSRSRGSCSARTWSVPTSPSCCPSSLWPNAGI